MADIDTDGKLIRQLLQQNIEYEARITELENRLLIATRSFDLANARAEIAEADLAEQERVTRLLEGVLKGAEARIQQTWEILDSFPAKGWGERVAMLKHSLRPSLDRNP